MMSLLSNWVMPIFIYNPFSYTLFFQNLFCFPHSSKLLIFFSCGYSFHTNIKKMSFIFLLNFIFSLSPLISNAVLSNLWKNTMMLLSLISRLCIWFTLISRLCIDAKLQLSLLFFFCFEFVFFYFLKKYICMIRYIFGISVCDREGEL